MDMRGNRIDRQPGNVPSVWMPFERGVAASHLLVASGTHRLYYEKPFAFHSHIMFKPHRFEERVRRVLDPMANKLAARRRLG
jgi:hypothetical protein